MHTHAHTHTHTQNLDFRFGVASLQHAQARVHTRTDTDTHTHAHTAPLTDFGLGGVDLLPQRLRLGVTPPQLRLVALDGGVLRVVTFKDLVRLLPPRRQLAHCNEKPEVPNRKYQTGSQKVKVRCSPLSTSAAFADLNRATTQDVFGVEVLKKKTIRSSQSFASKTSSQSSLIQRTSRRGVGGEASRSRPPRGVGGKGANTCRLHPGVSHPRPVRAPRRGVGGGGGGGPSLSRPPGGASWSRLRASLPRRLPCRIGGRCCCGPIRWKSSSVRGSARKFKAVHNIAPQIAFAADASRVSFSCRSDRVNSHWERVLRFRAGQLAFTRDASSVTFPCRSGWRHTGCAVCSVHWMRCAMSCRASRCRLRPRVYVSMQVRLRRELRSVQVIGGLRPSLWRFHLDRHQFVASRSQWLSTIPSTISLRYAMNLERIRSLTFKRSDVLF